MQNKPNVLFVGLNIRYFVASSSLWNTVLSRVFNVHFYGPGFVDSRTLQGGVEKFIESIGGVVFIFAHYHVCYKYEASYLNRSIINYNVRLGEDCLVTNEFLGDVRYFLKGNKSRVCCFLAVDPHVTEQAQLDECLQHAEYFLLWGKGFLNAKRDMAAVAREKYIQKKLKMGFKLGSLDDFVDDYSTKIINLRDCVSDNEFYWSALSSRKYDVSVPGNNTYYRRNSAVNSLKKSGVGFRLAEPKTMLIYKVASRLFVKPYANFYMSHLYNLAFQRSLSQTKVCIVDGGANNYPVRKFLEVPAAGALLVCWPSEGLELLGFKNGINCFFVRDNDEALDIVQSVFRNPREFDRIAAAGRELVLMQHSTSARAEQLAEAFSRIQAGTFKGSIWQDGRFVCLPT